MSKSVNVNSESIRMVYALLKQSIEEMNLIIFKFKSALNNRGWNDSKHKEFVQICEDCMAEVFMAKMSLVELDSKIKEILTIILEYESINFTKSGRETIQSRMNRAAVNSGYTSTRGFIASRTLSSFVVASMFGITVARLRRSESQMPPSEATFQGVTSCIDWCVSRIDTRVQSGRAMRIIGSHSNNC